VQSHLTRFTGKDAASTREFNIFNDELLGRVELAAFINVRWRDVEATPPNLHLIRAVLLHGLLHIAA